MAYKKLMLVILELFILILLKVQANDYADITFQPSSPSIMLPHFPKLDKVQTNDLATISFSSSPLPTLYPHSFKLDEVQGTIHTCFADEIKFCKEIMISHVFLMKMDHYETCFVVGYIKCWESHHGLEKISSEHMWCIHVCSTATNIGNCAKECYEKHVKKHSNVVYKQNR